MDKIDLNWKQISWLSVSIITGGVLVYLADFNSVLDSLQNVSLGYFIGAFVVGNLSLLIHVFIWKRVFSKQGLELRYREFLQLHLSGLFIHNITPLADIGSQPFIAGLIQKFTGGKYEEVLSTLVAADFMLLIPTYSLALVAAGLVINPYLPVIALPLGMTAYLLYLSDSKIRRLIDFIGSKAGLDLDERYQNSKEVFKTATDSSYEVLLLLIIGLMPSLLEIMSVYLLILGTATEISIITVATITPLTRLSGLIPTPGSSGVYEVVFTGLLVEIAGIGLPTAVTVTVLYRLITYYFGIIIGYISITNLSMEIIE